MQFLFYSILFLQITGAFLVSYLVVLTFAAFWAPRKTFPLSELPVSRFLVLIPAHNEEQLLPETLNNLLNLDYPRSLYHIHVVADNCSDRTADKAAAYGAAVHERKDTDRRGKGPALQWALQRLWLSSEPHDAILILDADSLLSSNFLRVMDARLQRGEQVIQGYYTVRSPGSSWNAGLRAAALMVLHYGRSQGRMVFGWSAGLKGNGMVFAAGVLNNFQWSASLTEDIELHMSLLLAGLRVAFAPDAVIWGEMPNTLTASVTQHDRWERGRLSMARKYVPKLLSSAVENARKGRWGFFFRLLDATMEQIIPPFSILTTGTALSIFISFAWMSLTQFEILDKPIGSIWLAASLALSSWMLAGELFYLFAGLRLVNAPGYIYRNLVFAPFLVGWKIWQVFRSTFQSGDAEWIRTQRN